MGVLTLDLQEQPPEAKNLSNEGTRDWAHWGLTAAGDFNQKAGITNEISDIAAPSEITGRYGGNVAKWNDISWSDGTPTASETGFPGGIYFETQNNGFSFTVTADASLTRTLKIYLGGFKTTGRLQLSLSDASAAAIDDNTTMTDLLDTFAYVATVTFRADSASQTLTVTYTNDTATAGGNVALQAATLSAVVVAVALSLDAYDSDGRYSPRSLFYSIQDQLGEGDTWEFISSTLSPGTATLVGYDSGDWKLTPPSAYSGDITCDFILLDADEPVRIVSNAIDNGSGLVRLTILGHGLQTGDTIYVTGVGGVTAANDAAWDVTVIDAQTVDLQGSTFSGTFSSDGYAVEVARATLTHTVSGTATPVTRRDLPFVPGRTV